MRKFIFSLFTFIAFAAVFYTVALVALPSFFKMNLLYKPGSLGYMNTRTKDLHSFENVDILFLGSSHAYRGFDTRIFDSAGFRSFNLGSSIQTPIQGQVLLEKYLDKLHPRLVVYEVSTVVFVNDGVESSLDLIANDRITPETVKMATEINEVRTYNTLLYGAVKQMFGAYEKFNEVPSNGDTYIKGGYVERRMAFFRHKVFAREKLEFNYRLFSFLNKNLKYLTNKKVKVILVQAPITSASYSSYSNNAEFDNLMRSTKVPYYNFNNMLHLDDSLHFLNEHHLNQDGVRVFNDSLIHLIKTLPLDFSKRSP